MKLIKPSYEIVPQEAGLEGIYKAIERAGRTCYKSEDKITPTSAKEFADRMIKSGHHAMLEFGTVYMHVTVPFRKDEGGVVDESSKEWKLLVKYRKNPYSIVMSREWSVFNHTEGWITTNYRVIIENNWLSDLKYMCEPTKYHEKRVCVRFTTDRGISHELVRHRVFSFAQESTRQWRH